MFLQQKLIKRIIVRTEKECEESQEKENHLQATDNFHRLQVDQTC